MIFPLNVYLLALITACLTSAVTLPIWRRFCIAVDLVDDPGHRKIHEHTIALAGGLAVITGIVVPIAIGLAAIEFHWLEPNTAHLIQHGFMRRGIELGGIVFGALGMLIVGLCDDRWELKPVLKFTGQSLAALAVAVCGLRVTLFIHNTVFSYAITVLWILTVTNSFNFMDNMNGLCAGLGAISASCFGIISAVEGQYLVALVAFLIVGSLVGFLPYNFPKAVSFLGDAGSHLTGFLLSILAILPHFYNPHHSNKAAVFTPLLVLAVPLGDLAWVVILRWKLGKPFYVGDNNHLSHRLVRRNISRKNAVLIIWAIAICCGTLGVILSLVS